MDHPGNLRFGEGDVCLSSTRLGRARTSLAQRRQTTDAHVALEIFVLVAHGTFDVARSKFLVVLYLVFVSLCFSS